MLKIAGARTTLAEGTTEPASSHQKLQDKNIAATVSQATADAGSKRGAVSLGVVRTCRGSQLAAGCACSCVFLHAVVSMTFYSAQFTQILVVVHKRKVVSFMETCTPALKRFQNAVIRNRPC